MNKKIDIRKLKENPDNPRTISDFMRSKLIQSVLVFPKMLHLRPLIVNDGLMVLGGNQRLSAMLSIADMEDNEVEDYLLEQRKYRLMPQQEKDALLTFWREWRRKPIAEVRQARSASQEEADEAGLFTDMLSEDDEMQLLTKDNMHYGEDDFDILRKTFDREAIEDYIGDLPWNMYDYGEDKINDKEVTEAQIHAKVFKCGYIECVVSDEESDMLEKALERYLADHDGNSDGFLTFLLNYNLEDAA